MAERQVDETGKDDEGDIVALCGDWGKVDKVTAISHLEASPQTHHYFVEKELPRVDVQVVSEAGGKYLRTTPDSSKANNLDNLPDC